MSDGSHEAHQEHAEIEPDRLRAGVIAGAVVVICIVIVALVGVAYQYFTDRVEAEIDRKVLDAPALQLDELRQREVQRLGHYQWADQKAGVVRIPVEQAQKLVLEDYAKPAPPPPVAADPNALPTNGNDAPDRVAPPGTPALGATTPGEQSDKSAAVEMRDSGKNFEKRSIAADKSTAVHAIDSKNPNPNFNKPNQPKTEEDHK